MVASFEFGDDDFSIVYGMRKEKIESMLRDASPNQDNPKDVYVYGHFDQHGALFYVGKGTGKRAWSKNRHPLWHRYVNDHLNGKYSIRILIDGLSAEDAENLEFGLIALHGEHLVNWINPGRRTNYAMLEKYYELRDANRQLIEKTRMIEKTDIELAIRNYETAIKNISKYAFMNFESGLVGQLLQEENDELGRRGEIAALDRLTLCLIKVGRVHEAAEHAKSYFEQYKRDAGTKSGRRIKKRIDRALEKRVS